MRAIALDDSLAEAHTSLAKLRMDVDWDWQESEKEFRRAITLNPGYVTAHHWYGDVYLSAMGRDQEAIEEMKRALDLDPNSANLNADLGWCYIAARRWDDAIAQLNHTLETDPKYWAAYHDLAQAYLGSGQNKKALEVLKQLAGQVSQLTPAERQNLPDPTFLEAYAHARDDERDAAEAILREKLSTYAKGNGSAYEIAVIYGALGKKDAAFQWLNKDFDLRDTALLSIKVDPLLAPLSDDPRFEELVKRFKFS